VLVTRQTEEFGILRVRPRPAALDVGDAEAVESLEDPQLVVHRQADPGPLRAVTQRRVVESDGERVCRHQRPELLRMKTNRPLVRERPVEAKQTV
jgi:hypothetical protein